jgi:hypothetical protein
MKKEISVCIRRAGKIILFICSILPGVGSSNAQQLPGFPSPKVYYSFNASAFDINKLGYIDHYNSGKYAIRSISSPNRSNTTDRFQRAVEALFVTLQGSTTDNEAWDVVSGKAFGLLPANASLPDNFTIACWVNIPSVSDGVERGILYGRPNFALTYKGHDIFLRRFASGTTGNGLFDYKFWAPASFDTPGWYELFLVFGTRPADKLRYVKIYVGKPGYIAYDGSGPKVVASNSSPLAWNFGGGYAFMNTIDGYNGDTVWGFGNPFYNSPSDRQTLRSVYLMDDVAVWDQALSENDAKRLFDCQSQFSGRDDRCWAGIPVPELAGAGQKAAAGNTFTADSAAARAGNRLQAYTSSRSTLQVNLTLAQPQGVNIYLYDMSGRLLLERTNIAGFQGLNTQQLPAGNLAPGIYVVKAAGIGLNLIQKVQIR